MLFSSWLLSRKSLSQRAPARRPRPTSARARTAGHPFLERLEDRLAPALLTVNTLDDVPTTDNVLTLREALSVVNSGSTSGLSSAELAQVSGTLGDTDTIAFVEGLTGTIILSSGELLISQDVTITGPGYSQMAISGNGASRVFEISSGVTVAMSG